MAALRMPSTAALTDAEALEPIFGDVRRVTVTPHKSHSSSTSIYSLVDVDLTDNSTHRCILKQAALDNEWVAKRTNDTTGREAALLHEPDFADVWNTFESPYLAFAVDGTLHRTKTAFLLRDFGKGIPSPPLLPQHPQGTKISVDHERALITTLATLHAGYWGHTALNAPWLTPMSTLLNMVGPRSLFSPDSIDIIPAALRAKVLSGWGVGLCYLPRHIALFLMQAPETWQEMWYHIPRTLVHGNPALEYFTLTSTGRISALEWNTAAVAPATVDLGQYLALNANQHAHDKDTIITLYRSALENALGREIPRRQWGALLHIAILSGALTMLWGKALAVEKYTCEASNEWAWWSEQLSIVVYKHECYQMLKI